MTRRRQAGAFAAGFLFVVLAGVLAAAIYLGYPDPPPLQPCQFVPTSTEDR